jgi:hypothetical protein
VNQTRVRALTEPFGARPRPSRGAVRNPSWHKTRHEAKRLDRGGGPVGVHSNYGRFPMTAERRRASRFPLIASAEVIELTTNTHLRREFRT